MITYEGNLLNVERGIIGHQVNCQRVMNAGVAQQIRHKWPVVYTYFMGRVPLLGDCDLVPVGSELWVANLYGQDKFGGSKRQTDYTALRLALSRLQAKAAAQDLPVYLPYGIGCGLGGGDWKIVASIIEHTNPGATIMRLPEKVKI